MAIRDNFDKINEITLKYLKNDPQYQKWLAYWNNGGKEEIQWLLETEAQWNECQ